MLNVRQKTRWMSAVMAALGSCAALAWMNTMSTRGGGAGQVSAELAGAVRSANVVSAATYARRVEAWGQYMESVRSPKRLRVFVQELIGIEQKLQQGIGLFGGGTSDEERVLALFRRHVVDERQLAAELQATVDEYERFLFEQDREIIEAAGISRDEWAASVRTARPDSAAWSQEVRAVVAWAVSESRQDAARFVASTVASDLAGDGLKSLARELGLDTSEQGSWTDSISGLGVDVVAGVAIDYATDATDDIVSRLSDEMARAEDAILAGDRGLFAALRQLKSAHETARDGLLTAAPVR